LERDALWQRLNRIRSFTLDKDELNQWLNLLERDSVIAVQVNGQDPHQDVIKLNLGTPLTQRLLGRMNVYGLIRNLRNIMGATRPDKRKPSCELVERLTKFVTNHDKQLADWTLTYAEGIKLVQVERGSVFLNWHSLIGELDQREKSACQALTELVKALARRGSEGWVPRHVVVHEMEKDTRFGLARGEHEYWLDQAIYRLKLLEEKKEETRDRRSEPFVRVAAK